MALIRREINYFAIDSIRPNLRLVFEVETIELVCREIRRDGQRRPIELWFDGEYFRILQGETTWRAMKKLGFSRVKAMIVEMEPHEGAAQEEGR